MVVGYHYFRKHPYSECFLGISVYPPMIQNFTTSLPCWGSWSLPIPTSLVSAIAPWRFTDFQQAMSTPFHEKSTSSLQFLFSFLDRISEGSVLFFFLELWFIKDQLGIRESRQKIYKKSIRKKEENLLQFSTLQPFASDFWWMEFLSLHFWVGFFLWSAGVVYTRSILLEQSTPTSSMADVRIFFSLFWGMHVWKFNIDLGEL